MIKRVFSILLLVILIMSLAGCNNSANSNELDQPDLEESQEKDEETIIDDSENETESKDNSDSTSKNESEDINTEDSDYADQSDSKLEKDTTKNEPSQTSTSKVSISLSIEGPDDDLIYKNDDFELIKEKMTALELLNYLQDQEIIRFEYMGKGNTTYLKGIGDYYEFDFGPLSGWMIEKNGEFPLKSIGVLEVNNGDKIRFRYTKELGDDLTN